MKRGTLGVWPSKLRYIDLTEDTTFRPGDVDEHTVIRANGFRVRFDGVGHIMRVHAIDLSGEPLLHTPRNGHDSGNAP